MSGRDTAASYQQVLAAIADALDVPLPASYDDRDKHRDLLMDRVARVRGVIGYLVSRPCEDPSHTVEALAECVADTPPTYPVRTAGGAS